MKNVKAKYIGLMFRRNSVLKDVIEGKVERKIKGRKYEEDEDVRSYWKTLRKRDDPGI